MAVETTGLDFLVPDGNDPVRNGDNVIAHNAQRSQDLFANARARLALLEQSAGFPGDPIALADDVVQVLVSDDSSDTATALRAAFIRKPSVAPTYLGMTPGYDPAAVNEVRWFTSHEQVGRTFGWEFVTDPKHGAVGNGLVDDTAAFVSALAGGKTAAASAGVYRLNTLTIGPMSRIVGLGANTTRIGASGITAPLVILKHQTSSTQPMIIINGGGAGVENVEMQANFSAAPLLHVENGFESIINNIRMISVNGTAMIVKHANNTKWRDIFIDNCGSLTQAAMVIKSPPTSEGGETNTLDIDGLTIERSKAYALDLAYGGTRADGYYVELVRISRFHTEAPNDSGGAYNTVPLVRVGNIRSVHFDTPIMYGGPSYLIEYDSNDMPTSRGKNGLFINGGLLLGQEDNSSDHLIHLVRGDDVSLTGVRASRFNISAIKIESTFGPKVAIDNTSSLDGVTETWLTDARTGWITQQINKSIGGTGSTGTKGGSVTTLNSSGATRNTLDDGAGGATFAGILAMLGGQRWINRTVTTTQSLTLNDMGVVSTATSVITLTLPASSNSIMFVKNSGTKALVVAAPASGTAPAIDGAASVAIMPGESVILSGRSSAVGTWAVIAHSSEQAGAQVPTVTGGANLGTGAPSPTLDAGSNDNRGRIQVGTGTSPAAGSLLTVTFGAPFQSVPFVQLSVAAQNGTGPFVKNVTATGFEIGLLAAPAASQGVGTYAFSYRVAA